MENHSLDDNGSARDKVSARDNGPAPDSRPVILFDGACNLCNAMVGWAKRRDAKSRFRFAPLRSDEAARLLARAGATAVDSAWARAGTWHASDSSGCADPADPGSIALVQDRKVHFRSGAVLRIAWHLKFPYPLLAAGLLAPRPLRDAAYDWVARNRYRWFGRDASCPLPSARAEPTVGAVPGAAAVPGIGDEPNAAPLASHDEDSSPRARASSD